MYEVPFRGDRASRNSPTTHGPKQVSADSRFHSLASFRSGHPAVSLSPFSKRKRKKAEGYDAQCRGFGDGRPHYRETASTQFVFDFADDYSAFVDEVCNRNAAHQIRRKVLMEVEHAFCSSSPPCCAPETTLEGIGADLVSAVRPLEARANRTIGVQIFKRFRRAVPQRRSSLGRTRRINPPDLLIAVNAKRFRVRDAGGVKVYERFCGSVPQSSRQRRRYQRGSNLGSRMRCTSG